MTVSKDKLIDILTQGYYIFFRNSSGLARCLLPYKHTPETAEALVTRFMAGEKPGKEGIFSWLPLFLSTESGPLHPQSSSLLSGWTSRLGAVGGLYAIPAVSHDPSNEKFSGIGLGSPVLDLLASIQAAYGTLSGSTLETIFEGFVSQTDLQPALVARLFVSIGLASNGDVCSMARGWGGQKSLPGKEILAALEDPSYSIAIRAEGYLAERRLRKLTQPRWVMSPLGLRFCSGLREERAKEILVLLGLIGDSNLITKDRIQSLLSVTVSSIDELSILYALISETPVEDRAKAFGDYKISPDTFIGLRQPIGQDLDYARDISKSDTLVHLTASIHATLTEGVIGARHILEHSDFESKKRFEDVSEALYYLASRSGPEIAQDLMGSNNPKVIAVGRKIMDKLQIFDWDKFASDLTSPRWLGLTSGELNFCVGLRREDVLRALEFLKTQIEGGKIPSLIARKCCDILGSSEVISYLHEEGMVESGWQFFGNVSVRMTGRDTPIPRDQADKVSFMLPVPIEEDRAVAVGDTPTIKNFSASVAALIRRCRASSTIPDLRPLMRRGNMFSQRDAETCILDTIVSLHRKNKLTRDVLERIASSLQDMPRVHGFLDNYLRSSAKQSLSTKTKEVLTSRKWLLKFKAHGPGYQEIVWGGRLPPFQADQIFIRLNLSREKIPSSEIRAFIDAEIDNLPRSVLHSILFSLSYLGKLEDTTFLHVPSKKMVDAGISTIFQRYGGFLPLPERGDITLAQEIESKYGHKWAGMDVDFTASFLSLVTRGGIILRGEAYSPPYFGLEIASWFVRAAMQIEHGVVSCLLALYEICKRTPKFSETLTSWSDQIATQKDEFNTTLGLVFKEIASGSFNPDTDVTQAQKDLWLSLQSDSEIASRGNQKGDTLGTSENRKEPVSIFEGEEKVDEKIAISPTWVNLSQLEAVLSVPVTALMREGFATANLAPETALSEARALLPLFAGKHGPVSNADLALWFSPPNDAKLIALLCMAREGYLHPDWISYLIREYPSSYDLACIQAILPTPKVLDLPALRSLFQENGLSFSHESFGVNLTVYLRMMQAGGKEPNLVSALRPGNTDEWQVKTFTVVMCEMIEQGGLDPALLNKPLFELESLASTETVQNAVRKIKSTIEKSAKTAQSDRPHPHVEAAEAFAEAGRVATKTRKAFLSTYGLFSVRDPNYDHCSTEVSITFADKTLAAAAVPGDLGTHDFFQAMAAYIRLCGEEGKTPNFRYLLANSSLSLRDKVKGFSRILSKSVDEKKIHADAALRVREDIHNANLFQQEMLWLEEDLLVPFNTPDSVSGMTAGEKAKCIKTLVNRGVDANWYTNQTLLEAVSIAETQSPEINGWVEADSFMRGKKDDMVPMAESLSDPHKEKHEAKNYGGEKANKDLTEALMKSDWLLTDSGVLHLDGMSEGKAKEIAEALIDSTSMASAGEDAIQALTKVIGGNQTVAKKIISSLLDRADSPSERVTQNAFQSTTIEKFPKPGPKEWGLCWVLGRYRYNPEIQGYVAAYILKCGREGRAPDFRRLLTSGTGTAISHGWVLVLTERALELGYLDRVKLREASEQLKNSQSIHLFSFGSDLENYLNELEGKETLKESLNVAEELTSPGMAALQMMSMGPSKVLLRLAEEVTSERKTEQWRAQVIDHLISRDDFQSYLELYVARALTYMVGKKNNETLKQEMAQAAAESITFSFGCTQADLGSPAPISHIPDSALLYEEMYRRVHHAYERKVQNRAVLPPGESYARVIASEEKRISEAFGVDDALKQVAAMKEALNLTQKRVWDKKAAMEPQVATKVAVPMLDPVKIAAGTASVVGSMAITDSTDEVKGTKETQRMKSDSNVAAAKVGTKASQKPLKGKAMEEEEEMFEDADDDYPEAEEGPNLGQILVKTLKEDGKTIALRTGVKHTREQLTALVTNFINSKSIRRFEGESDEAYTARAEAQRSGVSAFLLSDVGQQLITYLLGLSWPVLESNIEDGKVRKYGGMVAREIRAQSGSDLLDGFLEEVVFPLLAVITSEAKNFGKMVLAPAKRVRVSGLNESPADEKARLMERLAELERDANVVPMAKSR